MNTATRLCGLTALAGLAGAVALHAGFMAGWLAWWPALVRLVLYGWITGFILAVSYHAMPAFLARDFPWPALSTAHAALFALTTAAAAAADLVRPSLSALAGLAQAAVGALFVANVVALLVRGKRRGMGPQPMAPVQRQVDRLASRATSAAGAALPLSLGLLAATDGGWLAPTWRLAAEHLGTLGWVLGMVAGVGYHVLPRASGKPIRAIGSVRVHLALHGAAVILIVLALGAGWPNVFVLGAVLMAAAMAVFGWALWPSLAPVPPSDGLIAPSNIGVRR